MSRGFRDGNTVFVFSAIYEREDDAKAHWDFIADNWNEFTAFENWARDEAGGVDDTGAGKIFQVD
jgi:hypothetical protein